MFATEVNIKFLCEAQTIYVDGTFQFCCCCFLRVGETGVGEQGITLVKQCITLLRTLASLMHNFILPPPLKRKYQSPWHSIGLAYGPIPTAKFG